MKIPNFLSPLDIQKEKQEILKILRSNEALKEYSPLELDYLNILTNAFLFRLSLKINELNHAIANNYLDFASNEALDNLVSLAGIKRKQSTPPTARVSIQTSKEVFLPKNTAFVSEEGKRAYLNEDSYLKEGENICFLVCDEAGSFKTNILEINYPFISEIKLLSDFKVLKEAESDEELKKRFIQSFARMSTAGSKSSYLFYANVEGVKKIQCISPNAGEVMIVFVSDEEESIIRARIEEALRERIPITDRVQIKKAKQIPIDLTIKIKTKLNNLNEIFKDIKKNVQDYFQGLEIEESISLLKLSSLCFIDDGIEDIEFSPIQEIQNQSIYILRGVLFERI